MNIAICDDSKDAVNEIQKHIDFFVKDTGKELNTFQFTNTDDLLNCTKRFDIAILDIEIDESTGLDIGEKLRKNFPYIVLIFITAHKKYLDDALNLSAVRFFEKPIDSQRFYRGLTEAIDRIDNSSIKFYLTNQKTTNTILMQDIIFVEIDRRKSKVVTVNGILYSSDPISFWHEKLNASIFAVPHKSYIVNMNYISSYQRNMLMLNNKYKIPISRNRQTEFHQKFFKFVEGK